jgi:hypothetical protein
MRQILDDNILGANPVHRDGMIGLAVLAIVSANLSSR